MSADAAVAGLALARCCRGLALARPRRPWSRPWSPKAAALADCWPACCGPRSTALSACLMRSVPACPQRWHPDRHSGDEHAKQRFQEITGAFEGELLGGGLRNWGAHGLLCVHHNGVHLANACAALSQAGSAHVLRPPLTRRGIGPCMGPSTGRQGLSSCLSPSTCLYLAQCCEIRSDATCTTWGCWSASTSR